MNGPGGGATFDFEHFEEIERDGQQVEVTIRIADHVQRIECDAAVVLSVIEQPLSNRTWASIAGDQDLMVSAIYMALRSGAQLGVLDTALGAALQVDYHPIAEAIASALMKHSHYRRKHGWIDEGLGERPAEGPEAEGLEEGATGSGGAGEGSSS